MAVLFDSGTDWEDFSTGDSIETHADWSRSATGSGSFIAKQANGNMRISAATSGGSWTGSYATLDVGSTTDFMEFLVHVAGAYNQWSTPYAILHYAVLMDNWQNALNVHDGFKIDHATNIGAPHDLITGTAGGNGNNRWNDFVSTNAGYHTNFWLRFRLEKNGDDWDASAKLWNDGDSEPGTWETHVVTDAEVGVNDQHTPGYFGFSTDLRASVAGPSWIEFGSLTVWDADPAGGPETHQGVADASTAVALTADGTVGHYVVADASVAVGLTADGKVNGIVNGAAHVESSVSVGAAGSVHPATLNVNIGAIGTVIGTVPQTLSTATSWWMAADITGATNNDQVGTTDLTLVGSPTVSNDGTHHYVYLSFDSATYITAGDNFDNDGDTDQTILICYQFARTILGTQYVFAKRSGSANGYQLSFSGSTTTPLVWRSDGGTNGDVTVDSNINADEDTKVWSGVGFEGDDLWGVHDGAARATGTASVGDYSNAEEFRIGRGSGASTGPCEMYFYAAAVWDGVSLTDTELADAATALYLADETTGVTVQGIADVSAAVGVAAAASMTVGSPVERYWAPDKLAGLDLWLDADDSTTLTLDTADVITWADKSAAGQDFTQGTSGNRPVVATAYQNGRDAIQFTRANEEHLSGGDALDTSGTTRWIGVILEIGDDSVDQGILTKYRNTLDDFRWRLYLNGGGSPKAELEASWSGPGDIAAISQGTQGTGWVLFVAEITTDTSAQLWMNGVSQGYDVAGASTSGNQPYTAFIGTSNDTVGTGYLASYCLDGYIGEIVSVDGAIVEREELEGYLAHRWGLASLLPADHIFKAETPPGSSVSVKLGAAARIAQYAQADTDVDVGLTAAATVAYRAVADESVAVELGAAGSNTLGGVADLTVDVDLDAAASAIVPGAADTTVEVNAAASGTVVRGAAADATVAVDLSATGSIAVAGVADATVSVDLTAAATRVAGGAADTSVAVDLGAIGTVTQAVHQGIADVSVAIDLSAAGTVLQAVHQGIADVEVDVEVGATGLVLRAASADLSTDVDVGADATITSGAVADLTAEVDLGAAGSVTARTAGDTTVAVGMTARGSLMGQSVARIDVAVDLDAAATLAVAGVADLDTEIDLAAAGSVTAASVADVGVDVDLTAVGTITHGAVADTTVDVDLAAVGTGLLVAVADTTVDVGLQANGAISGMSTADVDVEIDLSANGTVSHVGAADTSVAVDLTADGTVIQAVAGGVADVSVDVGMGADGSISSGATADTTVDVGLAAAGTLTASGVADTTVEIDVSADGTTGGVQSGVADTTVDVEVGATCRVTLGGSAHCSVHVDMQADGSLPTSADIALAVAILARGTGGSAPLPVVVKRVGIRDRHRFGVRDRWRVGKPYGGPS